MTSSVGRVPILPLGGQGYWEFPRLSLRSARQVSAFKPLGGAAVSLRIGRYCSAGERNSRRDCVGIQRADEGNETVHVVMGVGAVVRCETRDRYRYQGRPLLGSCHLHQRGVTLRESIPRSLFRAPILRCYAQHIAKTHLCNPGRRP